MSDDAAPFLARVADGAAPVVSVVVAPGALPDLGAARRVLDRAAAARGAGSRLVLTRTPAELSAAVTGTAPDGEIVLVAGGVAPVADLALPGTAPIIRVDLGDRARDPSPRVRRHVRGRGLEGLRYAVDTWFFHRTSPATVHPYGPDPDQRAELRLPPPGTTPAVPPGGLPVAVLVHGGYWRSRWENDLMEAMAVDLAGRGLATWNVEYRRPDDHDWSATTADVAAAVATLGDADAPLDLTRVALLGHSAGGQLVTRLAADLASDRRRGVRRAASVSLEVSLTVSLAGVLDLVDGDRRGLGDGAVAQALGGSADALPDVYRASSPIERVPIGSPLAVVCGHDDELLGQSRAFARAARAAGDDVALLEGAGDHFAVIDPRSVLWSGVARLLQERLLGG